MKFRSMQAGPKMVALFIETKNKGYIYCGAIAHDSQKRGWTINIRKSYLDRKSATLREGVKIKDNAIDILVNEVKKLWQQDRFIDIKVAA